MTSSISNPQYDELLRLIVRRVGIFPNDHQCIELTQVLENIALSRNSINHLKICLAIEPLESIIWQEILQVLTIGETYFFRNQDQFNALRDHVLPSIIEKQRNNGTKQIRIWSAGCASGEEPYSLSILLQELIPDLAEWSICVLGTDINATSLSRAEKGVYRAWSFRNETPEYVQARWFQHDGDNYAINPALKKNMRFELLNLVDGDYPSKADGTNQMNLILFRNVSIYFDDATTETIIKRLHSALADDGWLVVGHAESLAKGFPGFTVQNFPNTSLYQKSAVMKQVEVFAPVIYSLPEPKTISTKPEQIPEVSRRTSWQQAKDAADRENWEEALKYLSVAERENKFQPEVYYLYGLIQLQRGNGVAALVSLRRALYCDSKFALAYYTLGELFENQKAYKEAFQSWQRAREVVADLDAQDHIPYSQEITVEMLLGLLDYRLNMLPTLES